MDLIDSYWVPRIYATLWEPETTIEFTPRRCRHPRCGSWWMAAAMNLLDRCWWRRPPGRVVVVRSLVREIWDPENVREIVW